MDFMRGSFFAYAKAGDRPFVVTPEIAVQPPLSFTPIFPTPQSPRYQFDRASKIIIASASATSWICIRNGAMHTILLRPRWRTTQNKRRKASNGGELTPILVTLNKRNKVQDRGIPYPETTRADAYCSMTFLRVLVT